MHRISLGIALFLFQCLGAFALDIPKLEKRVTDLAGVLNPDQAANMESRLQALETTDSTQIAVLIIPSLEGESLEDYSIRVVEAWKIGQKGRDNGALLLVSIQDHAIRIEVGYGLEGTLTDAHSSRIIRNDIAPRFRQQDFYGGIDAGITGIIETVKGTYQGNPATERRSSGKKPGLFNLLIVLLFPLLWILSITGKWGGGVLGAIAGVGLPLSLMGGANLLLLIIGGGMGGLLGMLLGAAVRSGSKSGRGSGGAGPFFMGGGGFGGGGFGGGGFGGFSGGGGGFGGGGSSGRW
jgi:uncharacterized protein